MKSQLNEVQKLQKIAGILKENINEAPLTINQVVKQLNKIANSKGFYAVDKSADVKPKGGASGVKNLVKWQDDNENIVELYYNNFNGEKESVTVDDLQIHYESDDGGSGEDSVKEWLDPDSWDYLSFDFSSNDNSDYTDNDNEDDEDPLYNELANEIGEKTLQKLLMKGWEIDDIAEDPQGAAASIK